MSKSTWTLDTAHTLIEFSVKHMMIATVKGRFNKFTGTIEGDPTDLTSAAINVTVDLGSVATGDEKRDAHLRSADFFDVEHFPQMTFVSKKIERTGDGEYQVTGDLTIRGTTHEVTLSATYDGQGKNPWGQEVAGFTLEGKINRKEWGLNWNVALEAGGVLVAEQVKISAYAELVKQATPVEVA